MPDSFLQTIQRILIRSHKRFEIFVTEYPGFPCTVIDKSSFLFMYDEIFKKRIYDFPSTTEKAFIIDCGANIGLATIFFKKLYPQAEIVAFEPDPMIFKTLEKNIAAAGVTAGITLSNTCLSDKESMVRFSSDGADGGAIAKSCSAGTIEVPAVRLSTYITKPVDFLKIDIEGAEYAVLQESSRVLPLVKNIFVEYHSFVHDTQRLADILKILTEAGFRYYIEHIGIRSARPYYERETDHNMDLQINIYGYRT